MQIYCDLHLHSKYSRATSGDLDVYTNAQWAKWKGINVVGTADFTHPVWFKELKDQLVEDPGAPGLFKIKDDGYREQLGGEASPRFMLTTETSHIYTVNGRSHRIHLITFVPSFGVVDQIQEMLLDKNININSDGRPILGMAVPAYCDLVLSINEDAMIIPAHVWTPWYGLYGSMSGFDSMEECFREFAPFVYAVETGLSSDPKMNWQVGDLDNKALLSFSDAHSPSKLGREATIIDSALSYRGITEAIRSSTSLTPSSINLGRIRATLEYYPEEGKYHFSGHRKCHVCLSVAKTKTKGEVCEVCGRKLTLGVSQRVSDLSSRQITEAQLVLEPDEHGVVWVNTPKKMRPPYTCLVPLQEILAEVYEVGVQTKTVQGKYQYLVNTFGSEFELLLKADLARVAEQVDAKFAEALRRVRAGKVRIEPGYDGEFGKVQVFTKEEKEQGLAIDQERLF